MAGEGHNLVKLIQLMSKVASDSEGITFFDDGTKLVVQMLSADAMSVTAVMPSNGKPIAPVLIEKNTFIRAYRPGAKLSGVDGKLNMSLGHWRMALAGSVEKSSPEPFKVEGRKVVADVTPLKAVPTEDNYGGKAWALFLPNGIAALATTYSMVAVQMDSKVRPKKTVVMQANAIYPMLNLVNPVLRVSDDIVGVEGNFPVGNGIDANLYIALAKPSLPPPDEETLLAMLPNKSLEKVSVHASELRVCIESAKKTFNEEATELTFTLGSVGLTVGIQTHEAAMSETVAYTNKPDNPKGKLVINTDVLVTAFKSVRELTNTKATAGIYWNSDAVFIRIVEGKEFVGAFVIAASEE